MAEALDEDCARADFVVSFIAIKGCPTSTELIGRRELLESQGLAIWMDSDGVAAATVRETRGERPWVR